MIYLYLTCITLVCVSFASDRKRTVQALRMFLKRFIRVLIPFLLMMSLISISLYLFPRESISAYLGKNARTANTLVASCLGCVAQMPGFIAFPLGSILIGCGVPYMVLSAFTTTLMMVGVLTFPFERAYLGWKVALARNLAGFVTALLVAVATGVIFREILI